MKRIKQTLLITALAALLVNPSVADTIKLNMGDGKKTYTKRDAHAITALLSYSSLQKQWDTIEPLLINRFAKLDPEADGYKLADQNKRELVSHARRRSQTIQRWLAYDLDGDGAVTVSELEQFSSQPMQVRTGSGNLQISPTPEQRAQILKQVKSRSKLPDPNKDGVTDFSEMLAAANKQRPATGSSTRLFNQISFEFDTDKNGVITEAEFLANHKEVFDMFDKDADQSIDLSELKDMREAQRATRGMLRK